MLSPAICGAVAAVLLLPFFWTIAASALRALGRRRDEDYSDGAEKLVLTLLLTPSVIGAVAVIASLMPPSQSAPSPLIDFEFMEFAGSAPMAAAQSAPGVNGPVSVPWVVQAGVSAFAWIYVAGALIAALRLIGAQWRLQRIAVRAEDGSAQWGKGVTVADTDAPPFVGAHGKIILPRTLIAALTPEQVALVIAHERAHVRRGDALYYALLAWVDALFWFNPFMRAQTQRCRLGAELACDAGVTAAAPGLRRAYAQTLILALNYTAGGALQCAPAVFSTRIVGEHRMRIREIMQGASSKRKRSAWVVSIAACLLAAPFGALQVAVAQPNATEPLVEAQPVSQAATPTATFSVAPLAADIYSQFGARIDPFNGRPAIHMGVDYNAPEGVAIVAPAAGRVTRIEQPGNQWGHGKLLEIDHGGGLLTRYSHLSAFDVSEGQQVGAGQTIGRVGNTGRSTHPHLHFMVLRDGEPIDPETVLPPRRAP